MINPKNLKKSILDYAIRGELSAKFRRENADNKTAFDEIAEFNEKTENLKKQREKLLSNENYVKKAPAQIVEMDRKKLEEEKKKLEELLK